MSKTRRQMIDDLVNDVLDSATTGEINSIVRSHYTEQFNDMDDEDLECEYTNVFGSCDDDDDFDDEECDECGDDDCCDDCQSASSPKPKAHKCSCSIATIMSSGCQCGGV